MKKLILAIVSIISIAIGFSQSPHPTRYPNFQGVLRNDDGSLMENENVTLLLNYHEGSETGTIEFTETHNVTTNEFGEFNIGLGGGTDTTGSYFDLEFQTFPYYLNISLNGTDLGTTLIKQVPIAQHAIRASICDDTPYWEWTPTLFSNNTIFREEGTVGLGELGIPGPTSIHDEASKFSVYETDTNYLFGTRTIQFLQERLTSLNTLLYINAYDSDSSASVINTIANGDNIFRVNGAGDIETQGKIYGENTGNANLLPYAYGKVDENGIILSGSSNFTVTRTLEGEYRIDLNNTKEEMVVQITPSFSTGQFVVANSLFFSPNPNQIFVETYDVITDDYVDTEFSFIIYKP